MPSSSGESGTAGPTITINSCYEGLAGANLLVASGAITIYSEDDCLNAANSDLTGYDFTMDITGGTIWAYAASDDGLDSNGQSHHLRRHADGLDGQYGGQSGPRRRRDDHRLRRHGLCRGRQRRDGHDPQRVAAVCNLRHTGEPARPGRQAGAGGNAPGGQQNGSTPPSMPDGQSGSQPQQPGGAQTTGTQQTPPEKPQGSPDGSSAPEPPTAAASPVRTRSKARRARPTVRAVRAAWRSPAAFPRSASSPAAP